MMKANIVLTIVLLLSYFYSYTQVKECDDKTIIDIYLSNPQPRLNEQASFGIDPKVIVDSIFESIPAENRSVLQRNISDVFTIGYLQTNKIGVFTIGPMSFKLNGTQYQTNEFTYEVIDTLDPEKEGLWIRPIKYNDNQYCIIIEQAKVIDSSGIDKSSLTSAFYKNLVNLIFENFYDKPLMLSSASSQSSTKTIELNGKKVTLYFSKTIAFIKNSDPNTQVEITRDYFNNLPDNYELPVVKF